MGLLYITFLFLQQDDGDDDKLWLELVMERILRAMDASLTVLYILTSKGMSKRVYLEDAIEKCVQFAKFQLNNTIYPSFDPVYRLDNKKGNVTFNFLQACEEVNNDSIINMHFYHILCSSI